MPKYSGFRISDIPNFRSTETEKALIRKPRAVIPCAVSITSASSAADIRAAFLDNLGYESANSVSMAQNFVAACRALLLVLPAESHQDRGGTTFSPALIKQELENARLWLAMNPGTAGGGSGRYLAIDQLRGPAGDPTITCDPSDQGGG